MEIKEKEIWKDIVGFEGLYQISSKGRVKSLLFDKEKILKQNITKNGYCRVDLCKDKINKHYYIHRLVATTFLDNPNNLPCVNHRDENPQNNMVSNLEWVTFKQNNNYGSHNERVGKAISKGRL